MPHRASATPIANPVSLKPRHRENLKLTRRQLLASGVMAGGSFLLGTSFLAGSDAAWALEVKALSPKTMATLTQMARDIYPHDNFGDALYVNAVRGHDDKAAGDDEYKSLIEDGVAQLDKLATTAGHPNYIGTGWEADRVALLKSIEDGSFFQTIRGGLVVGLYNQPEVWTLLGYEGSSFEKGGYIARGFDDINWL